MKQKLVILLFVITLGYTLFSSFKVAFTFAPDFSIFYKAGFDTLHHKNIYLDKTLYTAFNYPIATSFFFVPFAFLPYIVAQPLWTILNLSSVFLIVYVSLRLVKKDQSLYTYLFVVSLTLLSFPTKFTIGMGQTNLISFMLLLVGFAFLQNSTSLRGLFFLTIAIFLKPILGITLIVFLFEKKWQTFAYACACIVGGFLISPFVAGEKNANAYFFQLLSSQSLLGREVYYNQGLLGFISRLTQNYELRSVCAIVASVFFGLVTLARLAKLTYVQKLSLMLTVLVIIDPLSWQHHFVLLTLPFIITFFDLKSNKNIQEFPFTLFWISYIFVSINVKTPDLFSTFPLVLLLSHQLYAAVILFGLQLFYTNDGKVTG